MRIPLKGFLCCPTEILCVNKENTFSSAAFDLLVCNLEAFENAHYPPSAYQSLPHHPLGLNHIDIIQNLLLVLLLPFGIGKGNRLLGSMVLQVSDSRCQQLSNHYLRLVPLIGSCVTVSQLYTSGRDNPFPNFCM